MEGPEDVQTYKDSLHSFSVGQLVFAKVKGFPAWPARVMGIGLGNGCKYSVFFFGTHQTGTVKESHLWPYNKSTAARFCTEKMNRRPDFAKGMHQMNQEKSGWDQGLTIKLKEVRVMLANSKDAIRCAKGPEARVRVKSLPRITGEAGESEQQMKNGRIKKMAVKVRAMGMMKPRGESLGCEICSKRSLTAGEMAVHTAEEHLKALRIDLLKTDIRQKNVKSTERRGAAKQKMARGGCVEAWDEKTTCHNDVRYSKGIRSVITKEALKKTVESQKRMICSGEDSDDEVTFNYVGKEVVDKDAMKEMNEDTEDEEERSIDENSIEQSQEQR